MTPGIRVLVADDHPIILDGIQTLLAQAPSITVVGTARSFRAVSEVLDQVDADVLILDLGGMDGSPLALIHRLQREHPLLRVIVFSSSIDLAPELIAAGASGYVAKEELPTTLMMAISSVFSGQAFLSPLVQEYLEQLSTPSPLTPKEQIALKLLAQGLGTEEIAAQMRIDPRSVQNHITSMRRKTGCFERTQLVDWYRRTYGIVS
jgi:DNA-binding NarL/FixJ family response regulator